MAKGIPVWEHLARGRKRARRIREHVCTRGKGGCYRQTTMFGRVFSYCARYSYRG